MASRHRTRRTIVVAVAVVALAGGGCWWLLGRGSGAADAATRTVAASLTTMQKTVEATGTLAPTVQQDVSFAVSGTVTSVDVALGDTVTAGQTLATVDTLELDADLLSARADLAQAQAEASNLKSSGSSAQIAAASARVDVAAAAVTTAEDDVAAATLVAPVGGLVTTVGIETGDKVSGGQSSSQSSKGSQAPGGSDTGSGGSTSSSSTGQFTIVGTDSYQVSVTVGAADLPNITVGDQVEMTADSLSGTVFGLVESIGLVPSTTSGTAAYPVVVAVTGDTSALHDGVSVTAQIVYERRTDVLTVPSLAVTTTDGTSTVRKVDDDGKVTQTEVEIGEVSGQLTEIVSGLAEGDQVQVSTAQARTGTGRDSGGFQMPDGGQMPQMPDGQMPQMPGGQMPGGGN